jgi:hypothetical protein
MSDRKTGPNADGTFGPGNPGEGPFVLIDGMHWAKI